MSVLQSFFLGLKHQGSLTKLYRVKQGTDKGFPEPMYVFWSYMQPVYRGRLPAVCCMYRLSGFAHWATRYSLRSVLIFMKPKRRCTSVVSTVPLLIGREENAGNELFSRLRRLTTTWAVMLYPHEGFWTNPLVIVGEAPSLSQTGYKAYSYSPWAMIMLGHIRDANWHLPGIIC